MGKVLYEPNCVPDELFFSDYDFEASGLSNILDVLAYNTHFNGLTTKFALNENCS